MRRKVRSLSGRVLLAAALLLACQEVPALGPALYRHLTVRPTPHGLAYGSPPVPFRRQRGQKSQEGCRARRPAGGLASCSRQQLFACNTRLPREEVPVPEKCTRARVQPATHFLIGWFPRPTTGREMGGCTPAGRLFAPSTFVPLIFEGGSNADCALGSGAVHGALLHACCALRVWSLMKGRCGTFAARAAEINGGCPGIERFARL